jgi:DNA polymerase III delta prime subunit
MNVSLYEKYRPQKFNDIFISDTNKKKIKQWMEHFIKKKNKYSNCLLIHGPPGVGKTTIASIIYNTYNFDIIEYNASFIRNSKILKEELDKINGNINILDMMSQKTHRKKMGIIIDELDGIGITDKGTLSELIHIINNSKNMKNGGSPFICITNSINKKIDLLKKKSVYIKIEKPSKFLCQKLLSKILIQENIKLDNSNFNKIINICQFDYRRLINILEYIYSNTEKYNDISISNLIDSFNKKNINNTIIESSFKILNKNTNDIEEYYNIDKTMIGYYLYENFSNFIIHNCNEPDEVKIKTISEIYSLFSISDNMDYQIFINQNFEFYTYNYFYKCKSPSFLINDLKRYSINKLNILKYSTLINKNSLEFLNNKTFINLKEFISYNDQYNICNIIICYLINNIDKVSLIITNYNLTEDIFLKILKYSKYNSILKDYKSIIKKLFI